MIWGEPSRAANFQPEIPETRGQGLTPAQAAAPHRYAEMLDAAYGQIKRVSRRDLVIGGMTLTGSTISPLNWIKNLKLSGGGRPRMDLYGHNPFTRRVPNLSEDVAIPGWADMSDLDTLSHWLDHFITGPNHRKRLRLWLSEFTLPTDHANREFNFWVTQQTAAKWIAKALGIARIYERVYTFGYIGLYDEEPNAKGDEVNWGLLDAQGNQKPGYLAFKNG
jgi:hypothetical protein